MSWSGVSVLWPLEGQSDAEAIGAAFGLVVTLGDGGDHDVEATGVYGLVREAGDESDRLLEHVAEDLRSRGFTSLQRERASGHLRHWSLVGPLGTEVSLAPSGATVRHGKDFDEMWVAVAFLASVRRSVVWEPDDDVLVDTELTLEQARSTYLWL